MVGVPDWQLPAAGLLLACVRCCVEQGRLPLIGEDPRASSIAPAVVVMGGESLCRLHAQEALPPDLGADA